MAGSKKLVHSLVLGPFIPILLTVGVQLLSMLLAVNAMHCISIHTDEYRVQNGQEIRYVDEVPHLYRRLNFNGPKVWTIGEGCYKVVDQHGNMELAAVAVAHIRQLKNEEKADCNLQLEGDFLIVDSFVWEEGLPTELMQQLVNDLYEWNKGRGLEDAQKSGKNRLGGMVVFMPKNHPYSKIALRAFEGAKNTYRYIESEHTIWWYMPFPEPVPEAAVMRPSPDPTEG